MTTNYLFVLSIVVISCVTLFVGYGIPGSVESNIAAAEIVQPSIWNLLTFTASTFWSLVSFQVEGLHWVVNFFFWVMLAINVWCFVKLIRGTS